MTYKLEFHELALKEWHKLGATLKKQFKAKLAERVENPHVPAAKLRETKDRYKIKLRSSGYRLVYQVIDDRLIVQVIAIGKRDRNKVYHSANKR